MFAPLRLLVCWFFSYNIEWPYCHNNAVRKVARGECPWGGSMTLEILRKISKMFWRSQRFASRTADKECASQTTSLAKHPTPFLWLIFTRQCEWKLDLQNTNKEPSLSWLVSRNSRFSMVERLLLHIHPWPPLFRFVVLFEASERWLHSKCDFKAHWKTAQLTTSFVYSFRNCLRRIIHDDQEFSNQSIINVIERFVKSVNLMEETILIPSRLMDRQVINPINFSGEFLGFCAGSENRFRPQTPSDDSLMSHSYSFPHTNIPSRV